MASRKAKDVTNDSSTSAPSNPESASLEATVTIDKGSAAERLQHIENILAASYGYHEAAKAIQTPSLELHRMIYKCHLGHVLSIRKAVKDLADDMGLDIDTHGCMVKTEDVKIKQFPLTEISKYVYELSRDLDLEESLLGNSESVQVPDADKPSRKPLVIQNTTRKKSKTTPTPTLATPYIYA
jgi:hypothetical protein